ncbi:MAG: threonine ammonia-lyase, partial [Chloroflexota bacterium]
MDEPGLQLIDIYAARLRIREHTLRTPLVFSPALSEMTGSEIYLKLECWQRCGCFKVRGASNMVAALSTEERAQGVVTASSGNHGLAVARAAKSFGCASATIVLPEDADRSKVEMIRRWEPKIIFNGSSYIEAYKCARRYAEEHDAVYVHSHSH